MAVHEVTQGQWRAVMGTNPSHFRGDDARPVERVSWHDARAFAATLSERSPGNRFRLPTESEWEHACRAGGTTSFASGRALSTAQANIGPLDGVLLGGRHQTTRVGAFAANAWGLHDMHGNVWEWVEDDHCPYPSGVVGDPLRRCGAALKVIRGGSWAFPAESARCALRYTHRPGDVGYSLGFRIVRDVATPSPAR
jgi:formylglycine-generating enzyme required for sulfatase activity